MRKILLSTAIILIAATNGLFAQDSTKTTTAADTTVAPVVVNVEPSPLKISGSVDVYYRYNFDNVVDYDNDGYMQYSNNNTSFTNSQNAFQLGMASIKAEYSTGDVGGVIDLGFGPRAEEFSYADSKTLAAIKQAYVYYSPTSWLKLTAGKWGTHVGYELLDPQLNKQYSMSYMFSYGPFSHTGLKADFTLGKGLGLMVGIANPVDVTAPSNAPIKTGLAQVSYVGSKLSAYLNWVGYGGAKETMPGASSYNQVGLTVIGNISDKFSAGFDGTLSSTTDENYNGPKESENMTWYGAAGYFNFQATKSFGLSLRAEYFGDEKYGVKSPYYAFYPSTEIEGDNLGADIFGITISGQYKVGGFTILPEVRFDNSSQKTFAKMNEGALEATKSTVTGTVAMIYAF